MQTMLAALPPIVQDRAAQAIAEAFPGQQVQSLEPFHGGLSGSPVYRLVVDGRPFVLRIMLDRSLLDDPVRQLTCTRLASERDIAPPVQYASVDVAISISAYIAHQPGMMDLKRNAGHVVQMGELLRRLHSGPAFPVFLDTFQMIEGGLEHLAKSGVALPGLTQEVLAYYEPVKLALQPHLIPAPCHNDLNPGNVLYDGERPWLIDWEAACMNDPMFDLAGLTHWFLLDARQEALLLNAYFQRSPSEHELAKLALIKHVSRWMYSITFLLVALQSAGASTLEPVEASDLPSFAAAMAAIGRGELRLNEAAAQQRLSLVIAKESLDGIYRPEFDRALAHLRAE